MRQLIEKVHSQLKAVADTFEIVIIDDGSTDSTPKIADDLAREFKEVRVVHHPQREGYGVALMDGFRESRYDYVCYTDSDNQYDVRELFAARNHLAQADVLSGYVREKAVDARRKLQSNIFNALVRTLFSFPIRDVNCSMKLYKRAVLDAIPIRSKSAFIDAEMLIRAYRAGFTVAQFPVTHYERTSGIATGSRPSVILETIRDMVKFRLGLL